MELANIGDNIVDAIVMIFINIKDLYNNKASVNLQDSSMQMGFQSYFFLNIWVVFTDCNHYL
jgi:hypothetical protein